jgi:hypothetical protein
MFELIFQIIALIFAVIAAWLWYGSTKIPVPQSFGVATIASGEDPFGDNQEKQWANRVSEQNRRAALATAISVGAQGAAILASLIAA